MTENTPIDLGHVARDLNLPPPLVQRTLELLDEGNTVPFITRYRKDQTGGLDEEQIREIQSRVGKIRQLAERKATILKTIEAQGKLTPELAEQIRHANTPKRLEDLYLPFKPKKQTLATIARERGLEPLAVEIHEGDPQANDLEARAAEFVSVDKELKTIEDVLTGVSHLIAERFSENAELRGKLRRIFRQTGKITCTKVEAPAPAAPQVSGVRRQGSEETGGVAVGEGEVVAVSDAPMSEQPPSTEYPVLSTETPASSEPVAETEPVTPVEPAADVPPIPNPQAETPNPPAESSEATPTKPALVDEALPAGRLFEPPPAPVAAPLLAPALLKKKKKKKKVVGEHAFKDYYDYVEPVGKVPPHRVLAINRGERANAIRVKIESDGDALFNEAVQILVRPDHPHAEFLKHCVDDALARLIVPSLERELRREMSEKAEEHAVEVFIRNLRKLLLQPPSRGRRVLAIDPGFKSGSKMAALDEFGNVLGHGMIFVIGKDEEKRKKARARLADMVKQYNVSVIAIGNGTGCRETEQLVADCLADELADRDVAYVVVNEAGASIYSTSPLGREELPQFDALQRGAISIGRRLLDPLSELVKIHPANVGVGLYQHDIKTKHLKDSLDAVVESCVNFVGVDVNSASPALLRYVSGMNALTARRVYEHRREKGPFKNREELKNVPGFGEQTFVQAAGFLKVIGGENPLDATWIHPESYELAGRVLEKLGLDLGELAKVVPAPAKKEEQQPFAAGVVEDEGVKSQESGDRGQGTGESAKSVAAEGVMPTEAMPSEAAIAESLQSTQYVILSNEPVGELATEPSATIHKSSPAPAFAPTPESSPAPAQPARNVIADRANETDVPKLAEELGVGYRLLDDILLSLCRPGIDPRDNLPPPVFRRGIIKLEDLSAGMELSGTVLNVVDFGVFVDIGLSDSGLVHISRLADRYIRDPHEVVGVGDVLKVWVVEVDKNRRRVSLTAIPPGAEKQQHGPPKRERRGDRPPRQRQPPQSGQGGQPQGGQQQDQRQGGRPPRGAPAGGQQAYADRPPRREAGGRRDQRRDRGPQHPTTIEVQATKPKKIKPLTKAMEEGREPLRSFGDLQRLFDKKKEKPKDEGSPPETPA